ncbi:MAG: hypothetical protein JSW61_05275 [Candidatus Thorarchaeota archaeon]|nr:MAG: hypothetical protein JSW61_05275 [Candidatus Thorarchaeota archaeon]
MSAKVYWTDWPLKEVALDGKGASVMTVQTQLSQRVFGDEGPVLLRDLVQPMMMTLFFLESLRVFIGQIYFQNLGAMAIGISVLYVFLLLSPIAVFILKRFGSFMLTIVTGMGIVALRLALPFVAGYASLALLVAGLLTAFYGVYLPSTMAINPVDYPTSIPSRSEMTVAGFALALACDIMFRALGATWDFTVGYSGILVSAVLSAVAFIVLCIVYKDNKGAVLEDAQFSEGMGSRLMIVFLGAGFGGFMFLVTSFFAYPSSVARWTGTDYETSLVMILIGTLLYAIVVHHPSFRCIMKRIDGVLVANAFLALAAADLILFHSPLAGIVAGLGSFVLLMDLGVLWSYLNRSGGRLSSSGIFHLIGMTFLLFFTLFFVLSFVAGQVLPALEGFSPYIVVLAFSLLILSSLLASPRLLTQEAVE